MGKAKRKRAAPLHIQKHHNILYGIMTQFFQKGKKVPEIAYWVRDRLCELYPDRDGDITVPRERIYQIIQETIAKGQFVTFKPPIQLEVESKLEDMFDRRVSMKVANVFQDATTADHLGAEAAVLLLRLIKESGKDRVHIGLGSGSTGRKCAQQLALLMATETDLPDLTFHVMSNGYVKYPMTGPMSFLSYFADVPTKVDFVGLVSPIAVQWGHYDSTKELVGVRESFQSKDEISIIVSSLASIDDEHGLLNCLLNPERKDTPPKPMRDLKRRGVVGDLQFRPYNEKGPVNINTGLRAITLFELEELVDRVSNRPGFQSVLICGPCNRCLKTKVPAARPLISGINRLRVCNHFVTDVGTALELLELGPLPAV